MKLKTYLKNNPDKTFFIGSKVAYFFIGNLETFENDIQGINEKFKIIFFNSIRDAENLLKRLEAEGEPTGDVVKESYCTGKFVKRIIPHEIAVKEYHATIERKNVLISKYTEYLENYIPIEEREVIETYPKLCLKDGEGIKVDGLEEGRFWLIEEYETGYVEVPVGVEGLSKRKIKVK